MKFTLILLSHLLISACQGHQNPPMASSQLSETKPSPQEYNSVAYFASGCFWCVEAVFESVKGVAEVESGYAGGSEKDPTYEMVSAGATGHAEAVKIYYDSTVVDYSTLLKVFFGSHNPETKNQQGPDYGTQYRSAIYYTNDKEKDLANSYVKELLQKRTFKVITTEIEPLDKFYIAEKYHQNYEKQNPSNPYIRSVSIPRLKNFQAKYPELLKDNIHD